MTKKKMGVSEHMGLFVCLFVYNNHGGKPASARGTVQSRYLPTYTEGTVSTE